jgi:hypothetical protein
MAGQIVDVRFVLGVGIALLFAILIEIDAGFLVLHGAWSQFIDIPQGAARGKSLAESTNF